MPNYFTDLQSWDYTARPLENQIAAHDFVSSESCLLLTTPTAYYSDAAIKQAVAVGLTQDVQMQQQRQVTQIYEIGSKHKYTFSSGRTSGSLTISRVIFDGASLLRALSQEQRLDEVGGENVAQTEDPTDVMDYAGYGNFYINLGSSLFSAPVGIVFVMQDVGRQNIGAWFFQEAYIVTHGMGISANQPYIGENVSILFEGVYPIRHRVGLTHNKSITPASRIDGTAFDPALGDGV